MNRNLRVIMSILALIAAFAAVGIAKETVTLKWVVCCSQTDRHQLFESWARRYEARNPDIKIEWEYPAGTYPDILMTRIAGGAGPDVMWIGADYWRLYQLFMPLDNMKAKGNTALRETLPSAFPLFTFEGSLGAAPYGLNTVPLFVSSRVLGEAGMGMPTPKWTWQNFIDISKRLARDTNGDGTVDRFAFDFSTASYDLTAFSWGGAPFSADMKKAAFNNPVTVAATQMFSDLMTHKFGKLVAPAVAGTSVVKVAAHIQNGVGIIAGGVWAVPTLRTVAEDDWEALPFPWLELEGGRYRNSFISGEAWAINKDTKHAEEARRFVEFLIDKEQMTEFAKLGAVVPATASVARAFFTSSSSRPKNMSAFLDALDTANPLMLNHPEGRNIYTATASIRTQIWNGSTPAATALAQMEQMANQMLDEYWAKRK